MIVHLLIPSYEMVCRKVVWFGIFSTVCQLIIDACIDHQFLFCLHIMGIYLFSYVWTRQKIDRNVYMDECDRCAKGIPKCTICMDECGRCGKGIPKCTIWMDECGRCGRGIPKCTKHIPKCTICPHLCKNRLHNTVLVIETVGLRWTRTFQWRLCRPVLCSPSHLCQRFTPDSKSMVQIRHTDVLVSNRSNNKQARAKITSCLKQLQQQKVGHKWRLTNTPTTNARTYMTSCLTNTPTTKTRT